MNGPNSNEIAAILNMMEGITDVDEDASWFRFKYKSRAFQLGVRVAPWTDAQHYDWNNPNKERICVSIDGEEIDFDADFDEVFAAIKEANTSMTDGIRLSEADNYFRVVGFLDKDELDQLPSKIDALVKAKASDTVFKVIGKFENEDW